MKVLTLVGTRPEVIRLSRVIPKLDECCLNVVVHTGQNYDYELNRIFFDDLALRLPDYSLELAGRNPAETIAQVIQSVDEVLEEESPEAILILGDTNSSLGAIPAKRRKIPIFHMEAGNRCYDMRVPEEINRRIVDHIADVNLTYSTLARDCLLREGLPADLVIKTGSPMYEVLDYYEDKIESSKVLNKLQIDSNSYFAVSAHREENVDSHERLTDLVEILNRICSTYQMPLIFSTHPRTRRKLEEGSFVLDDRIQLIKPLAFTDYVNLQKNAYVVLSDSGTITEESSILNFPAINIRDAHERHEGMEEAAVILSGMSVDRVLQAIGLLETQPRGDRRLLLPVADYSVPNVSDKIVRLVLSYTDYVKRTVWSEY